jgi:hypothetical protein
MWNLLSRSVRKSAFVGHLVRTWRGMKRDLLNPYRPELHYMRGPGPKWQAKWPRDISRPEALTDMFRALNPRPAAARATSLPSRRIDMEPEMMRPGQTIA